MITRVIQRKRPRRPAVLVVTTAVAVALLSATAVFALLTDSGNVDVQVPDKTTSKVDQQTNGGAFISYFGDGDNSFGSSGTGTFEPFVRLQGSSTEQGYNTDGRKNTQFDTKVGTWTHSILVSEIPQRPCPGPEDPAGAPPPPALGSLTCFELFVDINDGNNAKHISLNDVEVWYTLDPNLTGYVPGATGFASDATKVYDFSGAILINDVNQGSGRGDLRYNIPIDGTNVALPTNCNYGNLLCETYFVLYSQWGTTGDLGGFNYGSEGGFEEWKVRIYPIPNTTGTQLKNTNGTLTTADDTNIADGGNVTIGTGVYDTATITGATADAGGTVSYYYQNQTVPGCSAGTLIGSAVTVTNGVVPASATVTLSTAGTYEFWAAYSGDPPDNNASTSPCGSETVVVGQNTLTPTSTPIVNIKDSISVSGFAAPPVGNTANVTVGLFSDNICSAVNQVGSFTEFAVPAAGGTVSGTTDFVAATNGTWYFQISYAGDTNNASFTTACTAESVAVTITTLPVTP
jgi:hypothetical protein